MAKKHGNRETFKNTGKTKENQRFQHGRKTRPTTVMRKPYKTIVKPTFWAVGRKTRKLWSPVRTLGSIGDHHKIIGKPMHFIGSNGITTFPPTWRKRPTTVMRKPYKTIVKQTFWGVGRKTRPPENDGKPLENQCFSWVGKRTRSLVHGLSKLIAGRVICCLQSQ